MNELAVYNMFTAADPLFYDAPEYMPDTTTRFPQADDPLPPGWMRAEHGLWIIHMPAASSPPPQGWKIHVSATLTNAETTIAAVRDYCFASDVAFKFLRSKAALHLVNSKYASRTSSGKALTVYPAGEEELQWVLDGLTEILRDSQGPYILSDLRWGDAPVYIRYGGFAERYCYDETGEEVLAIEDHRRNLVPDLRLPVFRTPSWVKIPPSIALRMTQRDATPDEFPYRIESALHFSNSGGVYVAKSRATGQRVVLKEARPHAGLDQFGRDSISRLRREHTLLQDLADLPFVPRIYDHITCWEHEFLVMEHVQGRTLHQESTRRHPLVSGRTNKADLAEYTRWALTQVTHVEHIVGALRERGIVFGDLHPQNLIVRPDGQLILIDYEAAFRPGSDMESDERSALAAPGFRAPPEVVGHDIDEYAAGLLTLHLFIPLTAILEIAGDKAEQLIKAARKCFPLPAANIERIRTALKISAAPVANRESSNATDPVAALAGGIVESATPYRKDRLYPADPAQYRYGGIGLAYGAAGVLHALSECGWDIPDAHVEWLEQRVRSATRFRPGLYDGLHGAAWALHRLGLVDAADLALDRALEWHGDMRAVHLFGGQAGALLGTLAFAGLKSDPGLHDEAVKLGERITRALGYDGRPPEETLIAPAAPGLMYGHAGVAFALTRLYEKTGDVAWLDRAETAIRADLNRCETPPGTESLQVNDGKRLLPYLAGGSAGVALALDRLLLHRERPALHDHRTRLRAACTIRMMAHAGLFNGRAGLMAYLRLAAEPDDEPVMKDHKAHLLLHTVPYRDHLAIPGDQQMRLSMDLATGSAGVLLALRAIHKEAPNIHKTTVLPLIDDPPPHKSR